MAYDPDRNLGHTPVNEYHRTTVEREGGGATWIVIGLLFAAIVAAIFFLFRPAATTGTDTIILDPAVSEAPADTIAPAAPAADVDVNVAPSAVAPADDAAVAPDAAAPADAAPVEAAPAD